MQPINGLNPTDRITKRSWQIQRSWLTPFTFGTFIFTAVTGILLFFNIHGGLVKPAHEWISWLLVIAALLHLVHNRRSFTSTLSQPLAKVVVVFFFLLLGASVLPMGIGDQQQHRHPTERITEALVRAPLSTVAKVANRLPEETVQLLWNKGIRAQGTEQSIQAIAAENRQGTMEILSIIFQGQTATTQKKRDHI